MNMKTKTMLAIAALSAAVAIHAKADAVVSSDVVGYLQQSLTPGVKTVNGTPFVYLGEGSFKLTQLIPMYGDSVASDGTIELSWYDYTKKGFRFVTWYDDLYDENDDELGRAGWAEDADNQRPPVDEATIEFSAGDWFFLAPNGDAVNPSLTIAGRLYTTDGSKTTTSLLTASGMKTRAANPLPVSTKLTEIIPMDGENTANDGTVELSWYDYTKKGFRFVTWYDDLYDENDDELGRAGWAEDADNQRPPVDEATIEFEPGRGFFIAPNNDSVTPWLAFPNPFFKD